MRTIFLTGHQGFIGSHLLKRLQEEGFYVYKAGRDEVPGTAMFDYVIHLAATTTLTTEFFPELYQNNIVYANEIFKFPGRIIYASSTSANELNNPYAYTKRYSEYLGLRHGNALGLRLFNCYGPGNNKGIIKRYIDCVESGEVAQFSGFEVIRDFIYIDDVVRIIIENLDSRERTIDVGTGHGTFLFDAIYKLTEVFGPVKSRYRGGAKPNEQLVSVAQPGFKDCLSLCEGLAKMKELMYAV